MRRLITTVSTEGEPDEGTLRYIETVYELDGWRNVNAIPHSVADTWTVTVFGDPGFCTVCGGKLIGSETTWETCGHCGHRSLIPEPAPAKTGRLTVKEGLLAVVGGWAVGVALGVGFILAAAIGFAASWVAEWIGGWSWLVLAVGGVGAVGALAWAIVDPEVMR